MLSHITKAMRQSVNAGDGVGGGGKLQNEGDEKRQEVQRREGRKWIESEEGWKEDSERTEGSDTDTRREAKKEKKPSVLVG